MKKQSFRIWRFGCLMLVISIGGELVARAAETGDLLGINLLNRYPTRLTAGDTSPERARRWEFTGADIFRLSHFDFAAGKALSIQSGPASLGIGHCADGAVWAVVVPSESGNLSWPQASREEVAHIWLRFHPAELNRLFPPESAFAGGNTNLFFQMRRIARSKMSSSWQAGGNALIPDRKDLTVDVDTKSGLRRFFVVDTAASSAEYIRAFERRALKPLPAFDSDAARAAFDQLWDAFDQKYALFALRPDVDWSALRGTYRPRALASASALEFAEVCAGMLRHLRDLHVWLTVAGEPVPVFNRPREANANPGADETILGGTREAGRRVRWTVAADQIGYIAIYGWDAPDLATQAEQALEKVRDTRGLILDVRLNGGGSEDVARRFAGRFLKEPFVYAYSQFRNGSSHTSLTEKFPRRAGPQGPWRYDRPVLLLIGQKCMSSNESFIGIMAGDPEATTMGDHTCGSSGNPQVVHLPLEMTVSVPQWIDYKADGAPLDGHGIEPAILFRAKPGAFEGKRDDLLSAALERMRKMPLPAKPIGWVGR